MINTSIVRVLRGNMATLRRQIEAGEEHDCQSQLLDLSDEADALDFAIQESLCCKQKGTEECS